MVSTTPKAVGWEEQRPLISHEPSASSSCLVRAPEAQQAAGGPGLSEASAADSVPTDHGLKLVSKSWAHGGIGDEKSGIDGMQQPATDRISFYQALKDPTNVSLRMLAFIFCSEIVVFTVQIWVTLHANSMAVFTDMVYGGFDLLSACATFIIEYLKSSSQSGNNSSAIAVVAGNNRIMDDVGSSVSLGVLFLSTLTLLWQAACSLVLPHLHMMDIHGPHHELPTHEVPNGNLVLFLVMVSVGNDLFILIAAWRMNVLVNDGSGRNMNAVAAIMHVLADLLRSFCVLGDGLIIKFIDHLYHEGKVGRCHAKEEEVQSDIVCTIVLCIIIILTCIPVVRELAPRLKLQRYEPVRRLFRIPDEGDVV